MHMFRNKQSSFLLSFRNYMSLGTSAKIYEFVLAYVDIAGHTGLF